MSKKRITHKQWGREEIFADNNEMYRGKVLFILKNRKIHLQYHTKKDETLYVSEGKGIIKYKNSQRPIEKGDCFRFKPFESHQIIAKTTLILFEVSNNIPDSDTFHLSYSGRADIHDKYRGND